MRSAAVMLVCLVPAVLCGCLSPDSRFNVNRGEMHDEGDSVGREGRGDQPMEKAPDGMGSWLYSPKYREINRSLGVED